MTSANTACPTGRNASEADTTSARTGCIILASSNCFSPLTVPKQALRPRDIDYTPILANPPEEYGEGSPLFLKPLFRPYCGWVGPIKLKFSKGEGRSQYWEVGS